MNDSLDVHCTKGKKPCTLNYLLILDTNLYISVTLSCRVKPRSHASERLWSQRPSPALRVERQR